MTSRDVQSREFKTRHALAAVLALALIGCAAPTPASPLPPSRTPAPTDTPTLSPTATPTATATRTPTSTPGPGLGELMGTPNAYAAAADFDRANAAYTSLAELYPNSARPWLGLAGVALRQGDTEAALDYLEAAAAADPRNLDVTSQWALLLEQLGRYEEAAAVYSRALDQYPDSPDLLVARAIVSGRLGLAAEAIADLQSAQTLDPYRQYAWLNAAAAASGQRFYQAAIDIATAGLEAHPDSVSLHLTRGLAHLSLSDEDSALADFNIAVALDPLSFTAYHWRGRTLAALGRVDEAIADLRQAGDLGVQAGVEGIAEGYEAMADAADLIAQQNIDEAFRYLADQVIQHGSQDALLVGYARIDFRRGNIPLAIGRLNGLVRDGFVPAMYWRGVIHAQEGNTEEAIADLTAFLTARRSGPDAEAARALLESLGVDPDTLPVVTPTPIPPP